jgi:photosynthetic reaction center cytochrome c subunit
VVGLVAEPPAAGHRMVRHPHGPQLNNEYINKVAYAMPANRKGPLGDPYKVNCATCHQGVNKPLYGVSMRKEHPQLWGPVAAETSRAMGPDVPAVAVPTPTGAAPKVAAVTAPAKERTAAAIAPSTGKIAVTAVAATIG